MSQPAHFGRDTSPRTRVRMYTYGVKAGRVEMTNMQRVRRGQAALPGTGPARHVAATRCSECAAGEEQYTWWWCRRPLGDRRANPLRWCDPRLRTWGPPALRRLALVRPTLARACVGFSFTAVNLNDQPPHLAAGCSIRGLRSPAADATLPRTAPWERLIMRKDFINRGALGCVVLPTAK